MHSRARTTKTLRKTMAARIIKLKQFSIRSLLGLISVISIYLAIQVAILDDSLTAQSIKERAVIEGVTIDLTDRTDVSMLGRLLFQRQRIRGIQFFGGQASEELCLELRKLRHLENVFIDGGSFPLPWLGDSVRRLEAYDVNRAWIEETIDTNPALEKLWCSTRESSLLTLMRQSSLSNAKSVFLDGYSLSAENLTHLGQSKNLRFLQLRNTRLSWKQFQVLAGNGCLIGLSLHSIDASGVEPQFFHQPLRLKFLDLCFIGGSELIDSIGNTIASSQIESYDLFECKSQSNCSCRISRLRGHGFNWDVDQSP